MLHCASREDWSFLDSFTGASSGTGGINDTLKSKGLTVEQIEHHIESLIRNSDHHHDNNHDSNHKSPISNEYKSWTELHENNEPIQEDPIATQQQDFASEAHESLLAHVNDSSWLLRYRHVLNNITSSSCTTTTPTTTTSSCSSNSSSNRNDEYDSSSQKIPYYDTMLSCPAIILYVASSSDEYPIEALMEMNNSNIHLPNVCKNGFYDVNAMKRYYLVLHDEIDGSDSFDEEKIAQEMNFRFGNVGGVVRLNSVPLDVAKSNVRMEDPMWDRFTHHKQWPINLTSSMEDALKIRGLCLSNKDKSSLRKFIAQMVAMSVIPSLERRINVMNIEVTNAKKGVKNVFKSFWRKPKESSGSLSASVHGVGNDTASGTGSAMVKMGSYFSGGPISPVDNVFYRFDSIESQTRLLADTLFLVKDYEAALSMYRLVKDDYKHDQNFFHTASTNEMMALCLLMSDWQGDRDKREIIHHIETAMDLYSAAAEDDPLMRSLNKHRPSVATIATRCVTRLSLLLSASPSLCDNHHLDIAKLLGNASSKETPLSGAILLEQSSSHYFRAGMYRKFAHHILMAGHLFRSAGQEQHALRCFASSMYIYHGSNRVWIDLFDHVTSALAAQLYAMKRMELCFELYAKLVASTGKGRVSVKSQQKFLDNLLKICRGFESQALRGIENVKRGLEVTGNSASFKYEGDEVLKLTPNTRRILEIPEINIPHVHDNSLVVESCSMNNLDDAIQFGTACNGIEEKWQDLTMETNAELKTVYECSNHTFNGLPSAEILTKDVIEQLDQEHSTAKFLAKSKRKANIMRTEIRAKMEPISVSFSISNPLGYLVPISSLQLIVRLKCKSTKRVYTNIEPIQISPHEPTINNKKWRFSCHNDDFEVANFSRLSIIDNGTIKSWTSGETEPFFVVSQKAVALDGMSRKKIHLSVCPLVTGDLEIVGMRCKIFNELWVHHLFSKYNGTLQHSNTHGEGKMSAEKAALLKSKIECNMPNLKVCLLPKRSKDVPKNNAQVLQGQVTEWTMRITNLGTAAADYMFLKTNIPWINIPMPTTIVDNDDRANDGRTSFCVGPSATLMRIPIKTFLPGNNSLAPSETVDIPVQIRTSGGGSQEFYILLRYQLCQDNTLTFESSSVRWLRNMVSLPVYPSLTFTASLLPSYTGIKDHILSVELTNYRSDVELDNDIFVKRICVASKVYEVKQLLTENEQNEDPDVGTYSLGHSIGSREQVTLHYLIKPTLPNACQRHVVSQCIIGRDSTDSNNKSSTDFICLEYAHNSFRAAIANQKESQARIEIENESEGQHPRSIAQIRRANAPYSSQTNLESLATSPEGDFVNAATQINPHPTSLDNLCSFNDSHAEINIICSWNLPGQDDVLFGQHHLHRLAVRPEFKSKGCPIFLSAQYDTNFTHDFKNGPLCVGLEVSILNRLVMSNVEFQFSLRSKSDVSFIGSSQFSRKLNGGEEISFPLQALLFSDGVYNLQYMQITVINEDGSKTPYVFPMQWIVHVNAKN